MRVIIALAGGSEVEEDMPEVPLVGDVFYNLLGRACVFVYKRDWEKIGNGWCMRIWVR